MIKKITLTFTLLILVFSLSAQQMPIDFDDSNEVFQPFNGSNFSKRTNPEDGSDQVGEFFNDGSNPWQGFILDLQRSIELSENQKILLNFYRFDPNAHNIVLKLEQGNNVPDVEVKVDLSAGSGNEWINDIEFDFSNAFLSGSSNTTNATGSYNRIVIFIDGGLTVSGTYLIDDIDDGSEEQDLNAIDVEYTELVWSDEFDGTTLDPEKWYHQTFGPNGGRWFNGEEQHYTDSPTNTYVEDGNLWNYKFTWNPRNVVLAGQGGAAKFIQEGTYKYIPYHKLFRRTEFLTIGDEGRFEAYANRDSLKYRSIYGLQDIPTMYRGTIRKVGFSRAWNIFVQLGMTDDSYVIENSENMSYRDFVNLFLAYSPSDSVELKLRSYLKIDQDDLVWEKLEELDLFNSKKLIGIPNATPAQMLQKILEDSWTLKPDDKDMIVMQHLFGYEINGEKRQIESSLVVKGENQTFTGMAKTVGLPVAIAAINILNGTIKTPGVQIPISKEVYVPILKELNKQGIAFTERKVPYLGYNPNMVLG